MASLGTAYIKIAPDLSGVQGKISRELSGAVGDAGKQAGSNYGSGFAKFAQDPIVAFGDKVLKGTLVAGAVAAGALIAKNLGNAISRVDTLNNFPKIMKNLGYETVESARAIDKLDKGVRGLPTSLDGIASAMQNIAPSAKSLDYATDLTLALNNALVAGGKSTDIQATAMEQFSQAIAKGKPDMMEWRSIATAMPGQLKQISESLGYKNWQQMAAAVTAGELEFSKVQDTLISLNKKGLGDFPSFADQARNASGGLQTGIANMNTAITRGIATVIAAIGSKNLSNAITGVGKAFETALNGVAGFFNFVQTHSDIFMPIIVALGTFAGIAATIATVVKAVTIAQTLWNAALLANPIVLVIAAIAALAAGIIYFFTQTETGRKIFETAMSVISSTAKATVDFIIKSFNAIKGFFSGLWDTVKGIFNDFVSFVRDNWFIVLLAVFTGGLALILGAVVRNWDSIKQFTSNLINSVVGFFNSLPGRVGAAFDSAKSTAMNIWNSIPGWFAGIISNIGSTAGRVVQYFRDAFNRAVSAIKSIDWRGVGMDIIKGIGSGIASMGGWLADQAKSAVGGAKDQLKSFLGIKSPSRVMRDEIGKMMGMGMAEGIAATTKNVIAASRSLSSASLANFATDVPSLNTNYSGNFAPASQAKQSATIIVQVGSKQIASQLIDDINDMSFLNGRGVINI